MHGEVNEMALCERTVRQDLRVPSSLLFKFKRTGFSDVQYSGYMNTGLVQVRNSIVGCVRAALDQNLDVSCKTATKMSSTSEIWSGIQLPLDKSMIEQVWAI